GAVEARDGAAATSDEPDVEQEPRHLVGADVADRPLQAPHAALVGRLAAPALLERRARRRDGVGERRAAVVREQAELWIEPGNLLGRYRREAAARADVLDEVGAAGDHLGVARAVVRVRTAEEGVSERHHRAVVVDAAAVVAGAVEGDGDAGEGHRTGL